MRDFDALAAVDWVAGALALLLLAGLAIVKQGSKSTRIYPPGPPRHPIWGNLFNTPLVRWHKTFSEWQNTWGMSCLRSFMPYFRKKTCAPF
jgi:hypothetical protein